MRRVKLWRLRRRVRRNTYGVPALDVADAMLNRK